MNIYSWFQLIFYMVVLLALAKPLGTFMAKVYQGEHTFLDLVFGPVERIIYRLAGVHADEEMNWKVYAIAMMLFNVIGLLVVYAFQRLQGYLPLNPQGFGAVTPELIMEYGGQLCHEYQLARLWRRNNHELSDADGGADGAEFPICCHRYGCSNCIDPRHCASYNR